MFGRQLIRRFTTTAVRRSGYEPAQEGLPGHNLPFRIDGKYKLTAYFIIFFGSGFAIPFLIVRNALLKQKAE